MTDPVFPDDVQGQLIRADWLDDNGRSVEAAALRALQHCRQVVIGIATGQLDTHLGELERMITVRRAAIFAIGARVRLVKVAPAYLNGRVGTIVHRSKTACDVQLPEAVGRFHHGHVWVKYGCLVPA